MTTIPDARAAAPVHTTTHDVVLDAEPAAVYAVLAEAQDWPHTFGPTVHARVEDLAETAGAGAQRLHLWVFAHERVRAWTSLRHLDPDALTIDFRQEASPSPLAGMGGRWIVRSAEEGTSHVVLEHDFSLLDDDDRTLAYVRGAVDANSRAELDSLARATAPGRADTVVSFHDTISTAGNPAAVYAFLRDAAAWPERLPHVSRLELTEPEPDVQVMEMDTAPPSGEVHTTRSVRVCLPPGDIVYKQTSLPPVFAAHTGRWTVRPGADGRTEVTSHHTVVLEPERIGDVLGEGATLERARAATRDALGANSRTTLATVAAHAEAVR